MRQLLLEPPNHIFWQLEEQLVYKAYHIVENCSGSRCVYRSMYLDDEEEALYTHYVGGDNPREFQYYILINFWGGGIPREIYSKDRRGKRFGNCFRFYKNGMLRSVFMYNDGLRAGRCKKWNNDGTTTLDVVSEKWSAK